MDRPDAQHATAAEDRAATFLALAFPALWAAISFQVPPAMVLDAGCGFLAWRGTLLGAPNYTISPDPKNIAQDTAEFLAMWSPGQYAVPGIISLSGLPLGVGIILTAAISLAACLLGWLKLLKKFAPGSRSGPVLVALIATFHFSTYPFWNYNGGEILLQGLFPWIVLAAFRLTHTGALFAAVLAGGVVIAAFIAKLSGPIVAGAAFIASGMRMLTSRRQITSGMIGGGTGALLAAAALGPLYLSRGQTAYDYTSWSFDAAKVTFAIAVPWVAGLSWEELLEEIFLDPTPPIFTSDASLLWFIVPVAAFMALLVVTWRPDTEAKAELKSVSLWFYSVIAAVLSFMFIKGTAVSLDERHFRAAGSLLFLCALIAVTAPASQGARRWRKYAFFFLCVMMSLYGVVSLGASAVAASSGRSLDRLSWTNHPAADAGAIEFLRRAYAQEGRRAVFVLPIQDIAITLPPEARVIPLQLGFQSDEQIAALRYAGRASGHVFILMQNAFAGAAKGQSLLAAFKAYPPEGWQRVTFASSSVFFQ